jgi:hypothetical protein
MMHRLRVEEDAAAVTKTPLCAPDSRKVIVRHVSKKRRFKSPAFIRATDSKVELFLDKYLFPESP